jgi:hypothetical protein
MPSRVEPSQVESACLQYMWHAAAYAAEDCSLLSSPTVLHAPALWPGRYKLTHSLIAHLGGGTREIWLFHKRRRHRADWNCKY